MRRSLQILLFAPLLLFVFSPVLAQTQLFPGASVFGRIADDVGLAQYDFVAAAGDLIRVRVLGFSGLDPALALVGVDGATLAGGSDDVWSTDPHDEFVAFAIPTPGAYRLLVGGEDATKGEYLLQFEQATAVSSILLPRGRTTVVPLAASEGEVQLQFATDPGCPTTLVLQPQASDGTASFQYTMRVYDEAGLAVAQVDAYWPTESRITFQSGSRVYWADIATMEGSADGALAITLSCAADGPACTDQSGQPTVAPLPLPVPDELLRVQVGRDLSFDQAIQGELGEQSPQLAFGFDGAAGDEVLLQVTGISLDFDPTVLLLDPSLEQIAFAADSPGLFRESDALISAELPVTGRYTTLVDSESGQAGAFLVRLAHGRAGRSIPVTLGAPVPVDIRALNEASGSLLRYRFETDEPCPVLVSLAGEAGQALGVSAFLQSAGGSPVGAVRASSVESASWVVPAHSGAYDVLLAAPAHRAASGNPRLAVACQMESAVCADRGSILFSTPIAAPTALSTPVPEIAATVTLVSRAEATGVVTVLSANVRRGDSTAHGVVRALPLDTQVTVIGTSASGSGWFKILTPQGEEGWMSPAVLLVADPSGLPPVQSPRPPATQVPESQAGLPAVTLAPGSNAICGNGWCEGDEAVLCCTDCGTCPTDQPPPPSNWCGDGVCNGSELVWDCPQDCEYGENCPDPHDGICGYGECPASCMCPAPCDCFPGALGC